MDDTTLSEAEAADLRCLAGMIIPPSAKYGVPGADDGAILADITAGLGRDSDDVRAALARLRKLAGGPFAALDAARRSEAVAVPREERAADVATLTRVVILCYYRDDRVMRSLGLEPRPPFPQATSSSKGTGRSSTPCARASHSGAQ